MDFYRLFIFWGFIVSAYYGVAQESINWSLTTDDDLPTNVVYEALQDQSGQIWIATDNGVCIYDGHQVIEAELSNVNDHFFATMEIDNFGRTWFLNISGELFQNNGHILNQVDLDGLNDENYIKDIRILDNVLWVHTLEKLRQSSHHAYEIQEDGSLEFFFKYDIVGIGGDNYFASDESFFIIKPLANSKENSILQIKDGHAEEVYKMDRNIRVLCSLSQDSLIGVDRFSGTIKLLVKGVILDKIDFNPFINRMKYIDKQLYVLTEDGYYLLDVVGEKLVLSESFFSSYSINDVIKDKEQNLWFATNNDGIRIVDNSENYFYSIKNKDHKASSVSALFYNDTLLYIGTREGNVFTLDKEEDLKHKCETGYKVNKFLFFENDLFIGNSYALYKFNGIVCNEYYKTGIKDFEILEDGQLVISMYDKTYFREKIEYNQKEENSSLNHRSYAVEKGKDEIIWTGNVTGLYFFDLETKKVMSSHPLVENNISDIVHYNHELSFVSTFAHGVYLVKNKKEVQKLDYRIEKILDLDIYKDYLAIASSNEVAIVKLPSLEINVISSKQLGNKNIQCIALDNEYLYAGTNEGLCKIALKKKEYNSEVQFSIHSLDLDGQNIPLEQEIELPPNNKNLAINYVGLSHKSIGKIDYSYRLIGLDSTWKETSFSEINFTSLRKGEYVFEIFAKDGDYSKSAIKSIPFRVLPRWYELLIVRLLGILLFGYLVFLLTKWMLQRRLSKEMERVSNQKRINGLKMIALQNQMNPHFISNVLYSIQDLIEKDQNWEAGEYTSNFADLIRRSMEYAMKERISLEQEIKFLKIYLELETKRFSRHIETKIDYSTSLEARMKNIYIPPLLIQPIIENCFKHAGLEHVESPMVTLNISEKDEKLLLKIEDNGVGINKSIEKKRKSVGLETVEQRLTLNAKQLDRTSGKKLSVSNRKLKDHLIQGTIVELEIDFKYGDKTEV